MKLYRKIYAQNHAFFSFGDGGNERATCMTVSINRGSGAGPSVKMFFSLSLLPKPVAKTGNFSL